MDWELYEQQHGEHLAKYLNTSSANVSYEQSDLEELVGKDAIAATVNYSDGSSTIYKLPDKEYQDKLSQFAESYGVSEQPADLYIWLHEKAHTAQRNYLVLDDKEREQVEQEADSMVLDYSRQMQDFYKNDEKQCALYQDIESIALQRLGYENSGYQSNEISDYVKEAA